MGLMLILHPENPQSHLIRKAVSIIQSGGVIVYPTDSGYALACQIGQKKALDRIRLIRRLDDKHHFTLVCRDIAEAAGYVRITDFSYKLLKHYLPGPYTFILKATHETPRRVQNIKRKTIGIRVPDHIIAHTLLEALDQPLLSTTLTIPDEEINFLEAQAIQEALGNQVDLIIDGGSCGLEPTSVIDLSGKQPVIVRKGKGEIEALL